MEEFQISLREQLTGISGVHITPFKNDGDINDELLIQIIEKISRSGVHIIVSNGNTAEFYSLNPEEIKHVQGISAEANDGRSLMMMAVGRSLKEAIDSAKYAKQNKADLIMIHQPMDPFVDPHNQANYILEIAESSEIPVVPYVRSTIIPKKDILRIAEHKNVVGIKFASVDLKLLAHCINETSTSEIVWICGLAESWTIPFYSLGARGFTSGLVNVFPEISLKLLSALEERNYEQATKLVSKISVFEEMRTRYNNGANVTVVKEALKLQGIDVGNVRLPGLPFLNSEELSELKNVIKDLSE